MGSMENLRPWKKGQSGNPAGRKTAGATIREFMNAWAETGKTLRDLRRIQKDPEASVAARIAAQRMIKAMSTPDIADYEGALNGEATLKQLRARGVDTSLVKKCRSRKRTIRRPDDTVEEIEERELELHERALAESEFVANQTAGQPKQSIEATAQITWVPVQGERPV